MDINADNIEQLLGKTVLVGLSYFDVEGELVQQQLIAGRVQQASVDEGIVLRPMDDSRDFTLPGELSPWFVAPGGRYFCQHTGVEVENPDYLVTWDVHRCSEGKDEGEHEWWEWVPNTQPPVVGAPE